MSFLPLNKLKVTEHFPPQAMLFELTTEQAKKSEIDA
jgi:hypothetical protein